MDSPSHLQHGRTGARLPFIAARVTAAILALSLAACSGGRPPEVAKAKAPATAKAEAPPSRDTVIIVHQAALFGKLIDQRGQTISVQSFVTTAKEPPTLGTRGTLFMEKKGSRKKDDWQAVGDVVVNAEVDAKGKMQFKMALDEPRGKAKRRFGRGGKIAKDARVKFSWEW